MRVYIVKEDYINYLKQFDINIRDNKNESRPYIGILLEVNGMYYIAPLASPKEKHKTMKSNIDFIKIENGELGVINLNNMIPVYKENIVEYNFDERSNKKYSILLKKQLRFINKNENEIKNKANKLYKKVISGKSFISKRCVNFTLVEKKALEYNSNIREAAITKTIGIKDIIKDASKKAEEHNKKKRQELNKREKSYER